MADAYDVYALGNAIVDTEVSVDDDFLSANGLSKGTMTLVSEQRQAALARQLAGHAKHGAAGGSAANTAVGVAQFGGSAAFAGKIGSDENGALYRLSMAEAGVDFDADEVAGPPTGSALILVTPDGERTMQTNLGASYHLTAADVDPDRIRRSQVLYVEGYLFGSGPTEAVVRHAMAAAASAGVRIALSLSDPGVVTNSGDAVRHATRAKVDLLLCNEAEAAVYTGRKRREESLAELAKDCPLVFLTCGGDGSLIADGGEITKVEGYDVPVVDTTGAGDMYAAGVLYGLTHGLSPAESGKLGSFAAARIVSQIGPRLGGPLGASVERILGGAQPLDA